MESGPAKHRRKREAKQHRIQQNKSTDSSIRVLAQHHQGNEPNSRTLKVHLASGIICQWNRDSTEEGVECAHDGIVELFRVFLARLEFEGAVVPCEVAR